VEKQPLRVRQVEQSAKVQLWGICAEVVTDPTCPIEKVRIVAGKTDETENVLHDHLLSQIDERGKPARVGSEIFLCQDERPGGGKRPMELDDPRAGCEEYLLGCPDDRITLPQGTSRSPFQERVIVRGEYVGPRQF